MVFKIISALHSCRFFHLDRFSFYFCSINTSAHAGLYININIRFLITLPTFSCIFCKTFNFLTNYHLYICPLIKYIIFNLQFVSDWLLVLSIIHNAILPKMTKFQLISTRKALISIGRRRVMRGGCCCWADSGSSSSRSRVRPDRRIDRN